MLANGEINNNHCVWLHTTEHLDDDSHVVFVEDHMSWQMVVVDIPCMACEHRPCSGDVIDELGYHNNQLHTFPIDHDDDLSCGETFREFFHHREKSVSLMVLSVLSSPNESLLSYAMDQAKNRKYFIWLNFLFLGRILYLNDTNNQNMPENKDVDHFTYNTTLNFVSKSLKFVFHSA